MKKILLGVVLAFVLCSEAIAGTYVNAHVISVRIDSSGSGMVFFDQPTQGGSPSCVITGAYGNAYAFNNSSAGRAIMALALAAKASGSPVYVYGLGTCNTFGGAVEDWDYGNVNQ